MKCNVGGIDRNRRIVLGIALLVVGLAAPLEMTWRIVALVVGCRAGNCILTLLPGECGIRD